MFRLHVVQALFGDCLLLEYGVSAPRYILIDGGPSGVFDDHLEFVLTGIQKAGGQWDAMVLTHVDEDHVMGLLDLAQKLKQQRLKHEPPLVDVKTLWFNTYSLAVGPEMKQDLSKGLSSLPGAIPYAAAVDRSIAQGDRFTDDAMVLDMAINPGFTISPLVTVDESPQPLATLDNLKLYVVGPTQKNLKRLRNKWLKWIKDQAKKPGAKELSEKAVARDVDDSVSNLSSIMFYAQADDKTVLLTGDGRGDHLVEGLAQAGLLGPDGKLHVDVLKLPHHGSVRNVSPEFFHTITADIYVISADGTNGNPDPPTLEWLVTAARDQGRNIKILITNRPPHIDEWELDFPPAEFGYQWLGPAREGDHELGLELG
jgi:beta-lactamase superfamily II metal-dependent hydrolase